MERRKLTVAPLLAALALTAFLLWAAPAAPAKTVGPPAPLPWPDASQAPLQARLLEERYSDGVSQYLEIPLPESRLRVYDAANWYVASQRDPRFALQLNHRDHPSVEIGFSLFEPDAFLPNLGEESWKRYLAALESAQPPVELIAEADSAAYGDGPFLFGKKYRYVEYIAPGDVRTAEFLLRADGRLLAVTLRGKADVLERLRRQAYRALTRMNLEAGPR